MLERLPRGRRNLALVALAVLLAWFAWSIRSVLNPLLFGYLLAFILHPLVASVQQRGFSRRASVNTIFFLGFTILGLSTVGLALQFRKLARDIYSNEELRNRLAERLDSFEERLQGWFGKDLVPDLDVPDLTALSNWARGFLDEHGDAVEAAGRAGLEAAGQTLGFLSGFLGSIFALIGLFVLVPLYTYYFLFELERMHSFVRDYLPRTERDRIAHVGTKIGGVIANFFRGRLGVCFVKGVVLWLGLWAAGVNYAFLFGMLSGFLSVIPFFGPFLGFLGAFLVGVLDHGVIGSLVRTGIVFGIGELLEGYVFIPKIIGDSLGLHPLVVIFALLAGGAAFGMFGVLIALPLTASLVILVSEFVLPALRKSAEET